MRYTYTINLRNDKGEIHSSTLTAPLSVQISATELFRHASRSIMDQPSYTNGNMVAVESIIENVADQNGVVSAAIKE